MVLTKYSAAKKIIAMQHHFQESQDALSIHLIKSNEHSHTGFSSQLKIALELLDVTQLETTASEIERPALKSLLTMKVKERQGKETLDLIQSKQTTEYKKHNSDWAPEDYLTQNWPADQKQAYVKLRTWTKHLEKNTKLLCSLCETEEANPTHLLVTCPNLATSRKDLIHELKRISPLTLQKLKESSSREKKSIFLGENKCDEPKPTWLACQEAFSRHALRICTEATI